MMVALVVVVSLGYIGDIGGGGRLVLIVYIT